MEKSEAEDSLVRSEYDQILLDVLTNQLVQLQEEFLQESLVFGYDFKRKIHDFDAVELILTERTSLHQKLDD